jgi:hypothetical protein
MTLIDQVGFPSHGRCSGIAIYVEKQMSFTMRMRDHFPIHTQQ